MNLRYVNEQLWATPSVFSWYLIIIAAHNQETSPRNHINKVIALHPCHVLSTLFWHLGPEAHLI